jgi:hypothetical protein
MARRGGGGATPPRTALVLVLAMLLEPRAASEGSGMVASAAEVDVGNSTSSAPTGPTEGAYYSHWGTHNVGGATTTARFWETGWEDAAGVTSSAKARVPPR